MVYALGIAQIISWGSLFYAVGVLGPAMSRELGVAPVVVFGGFTAGLVVTGLLSPLVGRLIDERGGRYVLVRGSLVSAAGLALLALSWNAASVVAAWIVAGAAMAASLYEPAFVALAQNRALDYRRSLTLLTIMGAFASTVFWPLALAISESFGWRAAWGSFAALQLLVCLPLHLRFVPPHAPATATREAASAAGTQWRSPGAFVWLSAAFALASFAFAVCVVHVNELLQAGGLSQAQAISLAVLIGPMQVVGRLAEVRLARRFSAAALGYLPFVLMVVSLAALFAVDGPGFVALAFVVCLGWGNGILTIARGTVPQEIFGKQRFGELLGRLALTSLFARALGPGALSAIALLGVSHGGSLGILMAVALIGTACYAVALGRRG